MELPLKLVRYIVGMESFLLTGEMNVQAIRGCTPRPGALLSIIHSELVAGALVSRRSSIAFDY